MPGTFAKNLDIMLPGLFSEFSKYVEFEELRTVVGELTEKAWEHDVQVLIEGDVYKRQRHGRTI